MQKDMTEDMQSKILADIRTGKAKMRPKWRFAAVSAFAAASLAGLSALSAFLINILVFSIRSHGPMGQYRLDAILQSFPWWAALLAPIGIFGTVRLLKRYDFSYKKYAPELVTGTLILIMLLGFFLNIAGFDRGWSERGSMRGLYRRYDGRFQHMPRAMGSPEITNARENRIQPL